MPKEVSTEEVDRLFLEVTLASVKAHVAATEIMVGAVDAGDWPLVGIAIGRQRETAASINEAAKNMYASKVAHDAHDGMTEEQLWAVLDQPDVVKGYLSAATSRFHDELEDAQIRFDQAMRDRGVHDDMDRLVESVARTTGVTTDELSDYLNQ